MTGMFNKREYLKNISDDELKIFLAKGIDKAVLAEKRREAAFSDFADPYKIMTLSSLVRKNFGLEARVFGGYEGAERLMAGFYPEYGEEVPFPIVPVLISYNPAYSKKLSHRDFLGSVLGLGIDRSKIGDIITADEGRAVVFCKESVADFVAVSLEQVGHTKVSAEIKEDISEYIKPEEIKETVKTAASERADAVLSAAFNISRAAAAEGVKAGKVFVNWAPLTSGSKRLSEGDVITLRGKGRVKLLEFSGKTKKDKLIIKFQKFN